MAVVVAGAGGHHRQPCADRVEEARQVRVAAVVGHLEHERPQSLRVTQQRALRLGLRVPREQHVPGRVADTQHHRVVVGLARGPAVGRRPEHLDGRPAQPEPLPGAQRLDRDAPGCGHAQGFADRGRRGGRVR
ncbi:MAG TPA: hypothetical protein VG452_03485 [Egibacteraceae bacterium]|nr:hypothetical protein [Egibacteraceae bacterium]